MSEPGSIRAGWANGDFARASLALVYVVIGASAIVAFAPELVVLFRHVSPAGDPAIAFGLLVTAVIVAMALLGARLFRQPITLGARRRLFALSLPMGLGALALALGIVAATGHAVEMPGAPIGAPFLLGTVLIVAAAAGEEVLLRGMLQPLLCRTVGPMAGIVATALAFAAVHVSGGWRDPISLINIVAGGLWFGVLAWRTGGIAAPILAHAGYNWAEELVFGALPNPGVGRFGALVDIDLVGPAIWGGSAEGLNASLALSLVLALMILILALGSPAQANTHKTGRHG